MFGGVCGREFRKHGLVPRIFALRLVPKRREVMFCVSSVALGLVFCSVCCRSSLVQGAGDNDIWKWRIYEHAVKMLGKAGNLQ